MTAPEQWQAPQSLRLTDQWQAVSATQRTAAPCEAVLHLLPLRGWLLCRHSMQASKLQNHQRDFSSIADVTSAGIPVGLVMCLPQLAGKAGSQQFHAFCAPTGCTAWHTCMDTPLVQGQPALAIHLTCVAAGLQPSCRQACPVPVPGPTPAASPSAAPATSAAARPQKDFGQTITCCTP